MKFKAVPISDPDIPISIQREDIKAILDITMKYRLYDGVHVQHPDGKYEYINFNKPGIYKITLELWRDTYLLECEMVTMEVKE